MKLKEAQTTSTSQNCHSEPPSSRRESRLEAAGVHNMDRKSRVADRRGEVRFVKGRRAIRLPTLDAIVYRKSAYVLLQCTCRALLPISEVRNCISIQRIWDVYLPTIAREHAQCVGRNSGSIVRRQPRVLE